MLCRRAGEAVSMGWGLQKFLCLFALQAVLIIQWAPPADSTVGVVYGIDGDNLPLPSQVVQLLKNNFVTKVRVYHTLSEVLKAFVASNIEVIVGIPNQDLATVGTSNFTAYQWVNSSIVPFASAVNLTGIAVGNDVLTTYPAFIPFLPQTMVWIHDALISLGLDTRIRVSTPVSTDVLQSTFPPSQSVFNGTFLPTVQTILQFLNLTGSYLMVNIRTFEVFQANPEALTIPYALFEGDVAPVTDAYSRLKYTSLFDALMDSFYSAMDQLGFSNVNVLVTETGWPSMGDSNQNGANVTNAQKYNANLATRVKNGSGTPLRPLVPINAYVYTLFNEDLQTGPTSERNYGLFQHDSQPVYSVDLTGQGRLLTSNGTQFQTWCVAIQTAAPQDLQSALDWACSTGGVNCSPTLPGGACYDPNTLLSHCSWVFNAYYQAAAQAPDSCDFKGVASVVAYDPSYGSCVFQGSNVTSSLNGSAVPPRSPNFAPGSGIQDTRMVLTVAGLVVLFMWNFRYLLG